MRMRRATRFLALLSLAALPALGGCHAFDGVGESMAGDVVSRQEQQEIDNDFRPRVRPVSGSTMVRVALLRPAASEAVNGAELFDAWRKHFERDRAFNVVPQARVDRAEFSGAESYYRLGSAMRISLEASRKGDRLRLTATAESNITGESERFSVDGRAETRFEDLIEQLAGLVKHALLG